MSSRPKRKQALQAEGRLGAHAAVEQFGPPTKKSATNPQKKSVQGSLNRHNQVQPVMPVKGREVTVAEKGGHIANLPIRSQGPAEHVVIMDELQQMQVDRLKSWLGLLRPGHEDATLSVTNTLQDTMDAHTHIVDDFGNVLYQSLRSRPSHSQRILESSIDSETHSKLPVYKPSNADQEEHLPCMLKSFGCEQKLRDLHDIVMHVLYHHKSPNRYSCRALFPKDNTTVVNHKHFTQGTYADRLDYDRHMMSVHKKNEEPIDLDNLSGDDILLTFHDRASAEEDLKEIDHLRKIIENLKNIPNGKADRVTEQHRQDVEHWKSFYKPLHNTSHETALHEVFNPFREFEYPFVNDTSVNTLSYRIKGVAEKLWLIKRYLEKPNPNLELSREWIIYYRRLGLIHKKNAASSWTFVDPLQCFREKENQVAERTPANL